MSRVVCVHGIGAQVSGEQVKLEQWLAPMNSGLKLAGAAPVSEAEVAFAFYGDLFRPRGQWLSVDVPWLDAREGLLHGQVTT